MPVTRFNLPDDIMVEQDVLAALVSVATISVKGVDVFEGLVDATRDDLLVELCEAEGWTVTIQPGLDYLLRREGHRIARRREILTDPIEPEGFVDIVSGLIDPL